MNMNDNEIVVLFEVTPTEKGKKRYMELASMPRPLLSEFNGFISAERFISLSDGDKLLSMNVWKDEASIVRWRNMVEHRMSQREGREKLFKDYTIRVARVERKYDMTDRSSAPEDSQKYFSNE